MIPPAASLLMKLRSAEAGLRFKAWIGFSMASA
jgi:hypothetical protein